MRRALVLLACLLALTGCSGLQGTGDKGYVTGDGQIAQIAVDERSEPIAVSGEDLEGRPLDLESFRGKPVVMVVWGAWCPPCRKEAPDVVAAAKELDGVAEFVGVNIRDTSTAAPQSFVRRFDVPYPSFYSPDGQALLPFPRPLGPNTIPATVVLDSDGRLAASIIGSLPSTQTLVDLVQDVTEESAGG
jgi:thiol-disulfide isomerase/thioredoxin